MGACVPVATALLAREFWPNNGRRALLAGGLCAVCGQLWQSSAVVMSDTTGLALATLGVWAMLRSERGATRHGAWWLVVAAILLAWATITRWIYGLVALVAAAYVLAWLAHHRRPQRLAQATLAGLAGGVILAWVLAPALSQGPTAPFLGTLETYGSDTWSLGNLVQRQFLTTGHGFVRYSLPNGVYYAAAPLHPFLLTPLLGLLAVPGLIGLARERAWQPAAVLLGWAGAMYLFHAGTTWQNLRYVLAYLPPVAVLAAVGADVLLDRAGRGVSVWLAVGMLWAAAGGVLLTNNQFIERKNADLAMVHRVDAQLPPDAELLTFGPTLTFRHYTRRPTLELFELSPGELGALLANGRPAYLLLDVANVEEQWAGRAPADNYHWLRDGPGLTPLGSVAGENLTLFRIGRA
jgi:4-amino-4-deoxy-L-arabinose transferase-like glycosyltransferase